MDSKALALSLTPSPTSIFYTPASVSQANHTLHWGIFPCCSLYHFISGRFQVEEHLLQEALPDHHYLKQSLTKSIPHSSLFPPFLLIIRLFVDCLTILTECNFHEARELSCFLFYLPNLEKYLAHGRLSKKYLWDEWRMNAWNWKLSKIANWLNRKSQENKATNMEPFSHYLLLD